MLLSVCMYVRVELQPLPTVVVESLKRIKHPLRLPYCLMGLQEICLCRFSVVTKQDHSIKDLKFAYHGLFPRVRRK